MIETREGLDAAEEIAAVPGVDALFVGPFDLGLAIGATQPGVLGSSSSSSSDDGSGGSGGGGGGSGGGGYGYGGGGASRRSCDYDASAALSPDPLLSEAVAHVRHAAHAAGKRAAVFCADGAAARHMALVGGFDLVVPGHDLLHLSRGAAADLEAVRSAFPLES